jgi:hypothetical protein
MGKQPCFLYCQFFKPPTCNPPDSRRQIKFSGFVHHFLSHALTGSADRPSRRTTAAVKPKPDVVVLGLVHAMEIRHNIGEAEAIGQISASWKGMTLWILGIT